ncbi:MAG: sulfatase-like hydrolase/transferase [Thermoleophilia bacterium]|nr:sulfatase-like hydrolase/transferase [Thermoleophilia bacterium]
MAICRAPEMASAKRPNFVLIQADDQTAATMHAIAVDKKGKKARVMPNTLDLIGDRGVEFSNYYASAPLCSPSRSTLLSGQYAHTDGLPRNSGKRGGALGFSLSDVFSENLAVSLQRAGYFTSHFGDFTNHYGNKSGYDETAVPPGWDKWATTWTPGKVRRYYGYHLNVNGKIKGPFGNPNYGRTANKDSVDCPSPKHKCNYSTDVLTTRAVRTIQKAKKGPMYIQVDYEAPHDGPLGSGRPVPATRYIGSAAESKLPKSPNFNERNIGDKPAVLRNGNAQLSQRKVAGIEKRYRSQLETLRAMDDGVGRIVKALKDSHRLGNTYIMVFSDHGYFLGEHRFGKSKFLPHEPASSVDLLVRGPRAKKDSTSDAVVGNVDLAPTIADLAGAKLGLEPDGRSFANVLRHPGKGAGRSVVLESYLLRSDALNEHLKVTEQDAGAAVSGAVPYVNYTGLRAGRYKYISYEPGGHELYDMRVDPYELSNKVKSKRYRRVVKAMDAELDARQFCAGAQCRKGVRDLPKPKPKPKPKPNKPGKNDRN